MKAVAAFENGKIEVVEVPMPKYGEYECLVRVTACGLCSGTDLKIINNKLADMKIEYPTLIGHEGVGQIVELGKKVRYLKVGDRIVCPLGTDPGVPYHYNWAGMAEYGITHDIKSMIEDGLETPMGLTELDYLAKPIPDWMSDVDAVMLLTFKENYSSLKNFGLKEGMDILIFGDGAVANGVAAFAKIMGANWVVCVGHHEDRLNRILKIAKVDPAINSNMDNLEEKLCGRKFDIVIDAVGSIEIVKQGAKMLKPGGRVSIYGVLKKENANLNMFDIPNNTCVQILNWPYHEFREHDAIVQMVKDGKINPKDYYSHVLPIDEAAKGVELTKNREAYKVIFTM